MKQIKLTIVIMLISATAFAQSVAINSTGSSPSGNAMMEVVQSNSGGEVRTEMGLNVLMPTSSELTSPAISLKGYSPAIELMDKDGVQNWFVGIDDNDNNKLLFGRGYGPGQDIDPAMVMTTSDYVGIGTISPSSLLQVGSAATSQIAPGIGTYGQFAMLASQQLLSFGLSDSEPWASWIQSSNPNTSGALPLVLNPSGGNVGIGTTSPDAPLHVNGFVGINAGATYFNGGSSGLTTGTTNFNMSIHASNDIVANGSFVATSDKRVKENITALQKSLDFIGKLRPVSYNKIDKVEQGSRLQYGFIAQEVEKVLPEAVNTGTGEIPVLKPFEKVNFEDGVSYTLLVKNGDDIKEQKYTTAEARPEGEIIVKSKTVDDFKSLSYDMIFTVAVGAIQEQQAEIEALKAQNAKLKAENSSIKSDVEALKNVVFGTAQLKQQ